MSALLALKHGLVHEQIQKKHMLARSAKQSVLITVDNRS